MDDRDVRLAVLAGYQDGCFSNEQARASGFPDRTTRYRVASGAWARLGPGSLKHGTTATTWRMQVRAGLFDLGGDALVAGRAAAALYSFDGFGEGPVEFVVPRRQRRRETTGVVHSTRVLATIDRSAVDGIAVTSATRTIVDLAPHLTPAHLERLVDAAVSSGWSSPAFLERRLGELRGPGRSGVHRLDSVLLDSGGHTFLERRFLWLVRSAGLPRPRCQVVHRTGGGSGVARVDFLFEAQGVVVEVMGRRGHAMESDRERDARRHAELVALGRCVVPFTSQHVFRRPDWVLGTLRRVLERAA